MIRTQWQVSMFKLLSKVNTQNMKCGYEDDVKDPIYFKSTAIEKNEMVQVVQDRRREKTQSMMGA